MSALRFLHLSDIHFRYGTSDTSYDLDDVIRHELTLDAVAKSEELGGTDAMLVTGDIAFSASSEDYDIAYRWITELSKKVGCPSNRILVVPGNHDIDWERIKVNRNGQRLRGELRQTAKVDIPDAFKRSLEDLSDRNLLLEPLENYNLFASKFGCPSTVNPLYWEHDLPLNDTSILKIRGINSVLVSDKSDSDQAEATKLILTPFQTNFKRQDDHVFLTMCHHPLDWLRDRESVEDWFDANARIQLFGHRHQQRVKTIGSNLRIAAGAVHPERGQPGWEPRFNWITVAVKSSDTGRLLHVEVHPRIWNDTSKKFVADTIGNAIHDLALPNWQRTAAPIATESLRELENVATLMSAIEPDLSELEENRSEAEGIIVNAGHKLTSRYMSLPHVVQRQIADTLQLHESDDDGAPDSELYRRYFRRAKERKLLEALWSEVDRIYTERGEEPSAQNPFTGR